MASGQSLLEGRVVIIESHLYATLKSIKLVWWMTIYNMNDSFALRKILTTTICTGKICVSVLLN